MRATIHFHSLEKDGFPIGDFLMGYFQFWVYDGAFFTLGFFLFLNLPKGSIVIKKDNLKKILLKLNPCSLESDLKKVGRTPPSTIRTSKRHPREALHRFYRFDSHDCLELYI